MNAADKIAMVIILIIGPIGWLYGDWRAFVVCLLIGVVLGTCWGAARPRLKDEGS